MIEITRINQKKMVINAELIEFIESTPDTIITTTTGKKIIVADETDEVVKKVIEYRRLCFPWKKYKPMTEAEFKYYLEENR
ncbi:flagellar FlbD family protein [candidate division KSB1 bacterium]